jgi:hypothetical protein
MTKDEVLKLALEALEDISAHEGITKQGSIAITAIKSVLAQPEQEPVEYQMRVRPTWEVTSWSEWKKCSRALAEDYAKTPKLHSWEYETRKLYTSPPKRQPLTGQQLIDLEMNLRKYSGKDGYDLSLSEFARAIELHHGIGDKT